MAALKLVVDNVPPSRAERVDEAVRAAAHAEFPWGVMNLGMAQVLQKVLWTGYGLDHFAGEVQLAWRIQNDPAPDFEHSSGRALL